MDSQTICAYNTTASEISALHSTLVPEQIYRLIKKYFIKQKTVLDIGCGIGRDCQWMLEHGFIPHGIDASEGMLEQARNRYKEINFSNDSLPFMNTIKNNTYNNVLCSAVIMHLREDKIKIAIENILRITTPGGIIIISYRTTDQANNRENGKLYTDIDINDIVLLFAGSGADLIYDETDNDSSRDILWTNLVFKKLTSR